MIQQVRRFFQLIATVFASLTSAWTSPVVQAQGTNIRDQLRKEMSPLVAAVDANDLSKAAELLADGADPNAPSRAWTPLKRALFHKNKEMISLLLEHGADARALDTVVQSHLQIAYERDPTLGALLFRQLKDAALIDAAEAGTFDDVRKLVDAGGDVNEVSRDRRRLSPLRAAVRRRDREMAAFLLDRGAALNDHDPLRDPILFDAACQSYSAAVTELLLHRGADPNSTDRDGCTPLYNVAASYWADVMETLIRGGADVNVRIPDGTTPLHHASARNTDPESRAIRILVKHGAKINAQDHLGSTPLHAAIDRTLPTAAMTLLDLGADPMIRDREGRTPLQLVRESVALYPGMPEVVRRLEQAMKPKH
jgi:ankyrin repeat protein